MLQLQTKAQSLLIFICQKKKFQLEIDNFSFISIYKVGIVVFHHPLAIRL